MDHDDVIKWKHFPRYWPFVRGIHRSPLNSPHKGQWRGALIFSLICAWINDWVNNRGAGDWDTIVLIMTSWLHNDVMRKLFFAVVALWKGKPPSCSGFHSQRANNVDLYISSLLTWTSCSAYRSVFEGSRHLYANVCTQVTRYSYQRAWLYLYFIGILQFYLYVNSKSFICTFSIDVCSNNFLFNS